MEQHLGLVRKVAYSQCRHTSSDVDYDDLHQEGVIGLIHALGKFEPERGFKVSSYAVPRIQGSIQDYLRKLGSPKLRGVEGQREIEYEKFFGPPPTLPFFIRWPHDVREALHTEIEALPPKHQSILDLYYAKGLSLEEIATALHLSRPYIASLHTRILLRLRRRLGKFR